MEIEKINISVQQGDKTSTLIVSKGESLYQILCNYHIYIDAPCAGNGKCGKCKIKLIDGELPITQQDQAFLQMEEIQSGVRLACHSYPQMDCVIEINEIEEYQTDEEKNASIASTEDCTFAIAIDIGTTTIAYELFSTEKESFSQSLTQLNQNRMYGADVMSRIQAANSGKLTDMRDQLCGQLAGGVGQLIAKHRREQCKEIVIAGNITMIHLLMGYSCETLGTFPFAPVNKDFIQTDTEKLKWTNQPIPVSILPAISTFIGGDIVSGLYFLEVNEKRKKSIFLDLGTNGEMALVDGQGRTIVTSSPAGPAFEGGSISCGTGSVKGAIQSVTILPDQIKLDVIGDEKPIGICGSGMIEILYELRANHIIDETGLLEEEYFESGYCLYENQETKITITQKDIREIQMAKAAIAAGLEILLDTAGLRAEEIEIVYLAGGFGHYLSVQKAIGIGLLKSEWEEKIHVVGNTSLKGAKKYISDKGLLQIERVCREAEEIYLSNIPDFQNKYMEKMYFDERNES